MLHAGDVVAGAISGALARGDGAFAVLAEEVEGAGQAGGGVEAGELGGVEVEDAEGEEGLGVVGAQLQGGLVRALGADDVSLGPPRVAEVELRLVEARVELGRVDEAVGGGLEIAGAKVLGAEVVPRGRVAGVGLGGLAKRLGGEVLLVGGEVGEALEVVDLRGLDRCEELGVDGEGGAGDGLGQLVFALLQIGLGHHEHGVDVLLVDPQGLARELDRLLDRAGAQGRVGLGALLAREGHLAGLLGGVAVAVLLLHRGGGGGLVGVDGAGLGLSHLGGRLDWCVDRRGGLGLGLLGGAGGEQQQRPGASHRRSSTCSSTAGSCSSGYWSGL